MTALAAAGTGLGLVLAGSGAGQPAAPPCSGAARGLGACVPGALVGAKPYVTAALIGFLLGAVIAIAAVLAWREARAALGALDLGRSPGADNLVSGRANAATGPPARRSPAHRGASLSPRARH